MSEEEWVSVLSAIKRAVERVAWSAAIIGGKIIIIASLAKSLWRVLI